MSRNQAKDNNDINRKYVSFGLIGYPLSHSLSPQIHTAAIQSHNLKGDYQLYPIPPLPEGRADLQDLLEQVRKGTIHGLNVTIPHKENVFPLLDEFTPAAKLIGAVNTIYLQDGRLWGDNTDAPGFWADVKPLLDGRDEIRNALVLGAGGSARAVAYALLKRGFHVTIAARRLDQAKALCEKFVSTSTASTAVNWEDFPSQIQSSTLLVNTTPLGMYPHPWRSPWPDNTSFPQNSVVYDLIYNPRLTRLVQQAWLARVPASTGMGMLVEQAALSFERWTGLDAPRERMFGTVAEFGRE
jgi:shikimate dehydrogenase